MINCESVERLLTLSVFESISIDEQRTVADHLRSCETCRTKAAAYRLIASVPRETVKRDADFWNQQRGAIMERIGQPRSAFRLRWATAAVGVAIVLAVGLRLPRRNVAIADVPDVQMLRDMDMIDNLDLLESLKPEDLS